jgi:hypothetical protein
MKLYIVFTSRVIVHPFGMQPTYSRRKQVKHRTSPPHTPQSVGRTNYRRAEGRCQSRSIKTTKDVQREDLWRFVLYNDLISLSIDNQNYIESYLIVDCIRVETHSRRP